MVDVLDRTRPVRVCMGELKERPRELLEPPAEVPTWKDVELEGMGRAGIDVDADEDDDVDDVSPVLF